MPTDPRPRPELSLHREDLELGSRGFSVTAANDFLVYDYRCAWPGCVAATLFPDRLRVVPVMRAGVVRCPLCANEVESVGVRAKSCEVKVSAFGDELTRLAVVEGDPMNLGRSGGQDVIPLDELCDHPAAGEVSRRHIALWLVEDGHLWAADLGSRNGSLLTVRAQERSEPRLMEPGNWYELTDDHVVMIGTALRIRRSGRRFVLADRPVSGSFTIDPAATVPVQDVPGGSDGSRDHREQ